jgi:16S rRNA (guanine966-N2)-methyltransferase
MRIIAGTWRGRTIQAPPGRNTRPILDRAKTVLFDILGNRLAEPGRLPPLAVLDLFSGSGALGLEALSRGARFCLFIEQDRASADILRKNLDALRIIREAEVIQANATTCNWPAPPAEPGAHARGTAGAPPAFELVFMDPPYRMLEGARPDPQIRNLLRRLATSSLIAPSALIVTRHEAQPSGGPDLSPLVEVDRRDVGTMTLRFLAVGTPATTPDRSTGAAT